MRSLFACAMIGAFALAQNDQALDGRSEMAQAQEQATLNAERDREMETAMAEGRAARNTYAFEMEFMNYAAKFGKTFMNSAEYRRCLDKFTESDIIIEMLNNSSKSATFAHNATSDIPDAKFQEEWTGLGELSRRVNNATDDSLERGRALQPTYNNRLTNDLSLIKDDSIYYKNWVTEGNVVPVKDQGYCGSCWAFSSSTVMESMKSIATATDPVRLSEQSLVDCTLYNSKSAQALFGTTYGCYGCDGCWNNYAFVFANAEGMNTNAEYPYRGVDSTCTHDAKTATTGFSEPKPVTGSVTDLLMQIQKGPIAASVKASDSGFRYYNDGVVTKDQCSTADRNYNDHTITIVGYGFQAGYTEDRLVGYYAKRKDLRNGCRDGYTLQEVNGRQACTRTETIEIPDAQYILAQNSWATSWGDNGFIKFSVDTEGYGTCGVFKDLEYISYTP